MVRHACPLSGAGHRQHRFQVLRCFGPYPSRADPQPERRGHLQDVRAVPAGSGKSEWYRVGPRGWRAWRELPVLLAAHHNASLSVLRPYAAVVTAGDGRRFGLPGGEMERFAAADLHPRGRARGHRYRWPRPAAGGLQAGGRLRPARLVGLVIAEGDVQWHQGQTLAAGQVAEFKVWAELVRQSMGGLHVFLPLRDMGIDGVVHRLADGSYMPVQVKARTGLTPAGQVHITVTATSLVDDKALVVATLVDGEQLGPFILVIDEAAFRDRAVHNEVNGREYLTAAFQLHSGGDSRWAPYLVARERLAERFGAVAPAVAVPVEDLLSRAGVDRGHEGFLGEMEVVRRLAEAEL